MIREIKKNYLILSAPYIVPVSSPLIRDGAVLIANGRINDIGSVRDIKLKYPDAGNRHFPDSILLPGLINAHIHLEYSALGPLSGRIDFIPWVKNLIKRQKELSKEEILSSISLAINNLLSSGVTSVGEVCRSGLSLDALVKSGLKGVYYAELVAVDNKRRKKIILHFKTAFEKCKNVLNKSRIKPGVFPHSVYTLSKEVLRDISSFSRDEEIPCGIHAAELKEENEFVNKGSGALSDFVKEFDLETLPPRGRWKNTLEYLQAMGLLTPTTQLIHCVHLEEEAFPLLEKKRAGIVLCPRSNYFLNNGEFPILSALKHDLRIGLGTDSLAGNSSLDMFEELRFLKESIKSGTLTEDIKFDIDTRLLEMATMGGADVLGMRDETGSLSIQKRADIIAVKIKDSGYKKESFTPVDYLISKAGASDVDFTMIDGMVKYDRKAGTASST
jgi:5-methylthioadenosine/S-adenosylhomocysteine deaminase